GELRLVQRDRRADDMEEVGGAEFLDVAHIEPLGPPGAGTTEKLLERRGGGILEAVEIIGDGKVGEGIALPGGDAAAIGLGPLGLGRLGHALSSARNDWQDDMRGMVRI